MNTCPICGHLPHSPYRRRDDTGKLIEACCDPCHESAIGVGTAHARMFAHFAKAHKNKAIRILVNGKPIEVSGEYLTGEIDENGNLITATCKVTES